MAGWRNRQRRRRQGEPPSGAAQTRQDRSTLATSRSANRCQISLPPLAFTAGQREKEAETAKKRKQRPTTSLFDDVVAADAALCSDQMSKNAVRANPRGQIRWHRFGPPHPGKAPKLPAGNLKLHLLCIERRPAHPLYLPRPAAPARLASVLPGAREISLSYCSRR
jgi:hypothetical protein